MADGRKRNYAAKMNRRLCLIIVFAMLLTVFQPGSGIRAAVGRVQAVSEKEFRFETTYVEKTYGDAPFTIRLFNGYDMENHILAYSYGMQGIASGNDSGEVVIQRAGITGVTAYLYEVYDGGRRTRLASSCGFLLFVKPDIKAAPYAGVYDGAPHSAEVTAAGGGTVYYSTDVPLTVENYFTAGSTVPPVRTDAGTADVYYLVEPLNGFVKTSYETLREVPRYFPAGSTKIQIAKAGPELKFSKDSISAAAGSGTFRNDLQKKTDGAAAYTSSDLSVAAVDRDSGLVTVNGKGTAVITAEASETKNYMSGTASYTVSVDAGTTPIAQCAVDIGQESFSYDGRPKTPAVTVKDQSALLLSGTDYSVEYSDNTNAGTAAVTVSGKGRYAGAVTKNFVINKAEPELLFDAPDLTKTKGSGAFTNRLNAKTDGTVTYASSDLSVAAVDRVSGLVTVKEPGTAAITASASAGRNYTAGSASYTLTVEQEADGGEGFTLDNLSYRFSNSRYGFGYPAGYEIPLEVFQLMFGDNAKARFYKNYYGEWTGNCFGMSSTSGMFNMPGSGMLAGDFRAGAGRVWDLQPADQGKDAGLSLKRLIEAMQVGQLSDAAQNAMHTGMNDLNAICAQVEAVRRNGPVMICMFGQGLGHAVAAYDLVKVDDSRSRMYIYDCNYPGTERYIELKKDKSGRYQGWYYYLNDAYRLGTDYAGCRISCVTYAQYLDIWKNRQGNMRIYADAYPKAAAEGGVLFTNAKNAVLYDGNGSEIARIADGQLQAGRGDIRQVFVLGIPADGDVPADSGKIMISLPAGGYTVKREGTDGENFEAAMTDTALSVYVSTSAETVSLSADDARQEVSASVDAKPGEDFRIELLSTASQNAGTVTADGTGNGETAALSQINGEIQAVNIDASLLGGSMASKKCVVSATAQEGGKIFPAGQVHIAMGESRTFTVTPDDGYVIADVVVDGQSMGARKSYTFEGINGSHAIRAEFQKADGGAGNTDMPNLPEAEDDAGSADISDSETGAGNRADIVQNSMVKKGDAVCYGGIRYLVHKTTDGSRAEVTCLGMAGQNGKRIRIPERFRVDGVMYRVAKIGARAFSGSSASKIQLPASLASIGKRSFAGCKNLKQITIPAKVTKIGQEAFYGCRKLKTVSIKSKNLRAAGIGTGAFREISKNAVLRAPKGKQRVYRKLLKI